MPHKEIVGMDIVKKWSSLTLAGSLLGLNSSLLTHGSQDNNVGILLIGLEQLDDLVTDLTVGHLDIILGVTIVVHQGEVAIIGDVEELVLATGDVGDIHVVGGGAEIFELLAGEDVESNQMDLGVTVLASLGGRHVDDLAGAALDDDEAVLPQSRALHGEGGRGTGVGRVEGVLMLRVVGHLEGVDG